MATMASLPVLILLPIALQTATLSLTQVMPASAFAAASRRRVSLVTGANGYLGREIVSQLLSEQQQEPKYEDEMLDDEVICLVREHRVEDEKKYWDGYSSRCKVTVMPYDMLDNGESLSEALDYVYQGIGSLDQLCNIYHVASVFGPTENHKETALENVKGSEDVVKVVSRYGSGCQNTPTCIVTSSMAAVRATNQTPKNGKWYTHEDWNTESQLGANWGQSYQWSKAQAERRCWALAKELEVSMVSLCPSFVFGPPSGGMATNSYSIQLVGQWIRGHGEVQSRLCVDVRDVAKAHIEAGRRPSAIGQRFIISTESRLSSTVTAEVLKRASAGVGLVSGAVEILCDTNFDGGAIKIGEREVECERRMQNELGVVCRSTEETMKDMAIALLQVEN